jgi:hypothetical protein
MTPGVLDPGRSPVYFDVPNGNSCPMDLHDPMIRVSSIKGETPSRGRPRCRRQRQRLEHARIAREEVALMFAEGAAPTREGDGASPVLAVVEEPVRVAGALSTGPVLRKG